MVGGAWLVVGWWWWWWWWWVRSKCIPSAFQVHSRCIPGAFQALVAKVCIPSAFQVHSKCIPSAFQVHSKCIPSAFQVHSPHKSAFQVHSKCILPTRVHSKCIPDPWPCVCVRRIPRNKTIRLHTKSIQISSLVFICYIQLKKNRHRVTLCCRIFVHIMCRV